MTTDAAPLNGTSPTLKHSVSPSSVSSYVPSKRPEKSDAGVWVLDCVIVNVPVVDVALNPVALPLKPLLPIVAVNGKSNEPDGSNAAPVNVDPETLPATDSQVSSFAIVEQFWSYS